MLWRSNVLWISKTFRVIRLLLVPRSLGITQCNCLNPIRNWTTVRITTIQIVLERSNIYCFIGHSLGSFHLMELSLCCNSIQYLIWDLCLFNCSPLWAYRARTLPLTIEYDSVVQICLQTRIGFAKCYILVILHTPKNVNNQISYTKREQLLCEQRTFFLTNDIQY